MSLFVGAIVYVCTYGGHTKPWLADYRGERQYQDLPRLSRRAEFSVIAFCVGCRLYLPRCFSAATDAAAAAAAVLLLLLCCPASFPGRSIVFGLSHATLGRTEDLGDLDRVTRIVKLVGFVNCTDGFSGQPKVVNGASDLFAEVSELCAASITRPGGLLDTIVSLPR